MLSLVGRPRHFLLPTRDGAVGVPIPNERVRQAVIERRDAVGIRPDLKGDTGKEDRRYGRPGEHQATVKWVAARGLVLTVPDDFSSWWNPGWVGSEEARSIALALASVRRSVGSRTGAPALAEMPLDQATSPAPATSNATCGFAESARGVSPRAAHRSGHEPLDSSGSCHPPKTAAFR